MLNKFRKDKKGVFGLTAVQQFFVVLLGIALLAYVIIIILGTLTSSKIIPLVNGGVINESGWVNNSGYTLAAVAANPGFTSPVIVQVLNSTTAGETYVIPAINYTVSAAGVVKNATPYTNNDTAITYTFQMNAKGQNQLQGVLGNTSTGIESFFGAINPVYAILAVLVIILVLVVLVRVVSGGGTSRESSVPL